MKSISDMACASSFQVASPIKLRVKLPEDRLRLAFGSDFSLMAEITHRLVICDPWKSDLKRCCSVVLFYKHRHATWYAYLLLLWAILAFFLGIFVPFGYPSWGTQTDQNTQRNMHFGSTSCLMYDNHSV
jgi:hypothetical protein